MQLQATVSHIRNELKDRYSAEEVEGLVLHIFAALKNFSRTDILLREDYGLTDNEKTRIEDIVGRLKKYEPVQYILGETEFFGLPFRVTKDVLIPRPETEELVEWVLKSSRLGQQDPVCAASKPGPAHCRILDIGTGSGCIAVSLKKHLPEADVYACDVSADALSLAAENALSNETEMCFFPLDILNPKPPDLLPVLDIIVINPPYVTVKEKRYMHANVLDFEPHQALFVSDDDPLKFYRAIVLFCKKYLRKGGLLYCEINEAYGDECCRLLEDNNFTGVELRKDINGKHRMVKASFNSDLNLGH